MTTIDIKDISGQVRFSVPIKENSVFVEELMKSDYIQLSWNSDTGETIPAGSYIEYNGEIYRLLEPYSPSMENEAKYIYSPKFQSRIMAWDKQITPVYTYEQDGTTVKSREMDWTFTGSPADAMYIIKQAIKNETGEIWNIELSSELPATISIQSQSSSIFSVLNTIATECNTEWWADKKTNTLYLSKCIYGDPITLEVGKNIQVPTVTNSGEGYFTRFYAFGSTRNIVQDGTEGNASVNKRLTLDTTKYPNGYKDIRENLKPNEIFVKVLYFDDIYPSSKLAISDVRARLRYRLDNSGNKIKIGGTDEEPVYEQYAIWYFQIAGFEFNPDTIIEGPNLSASFESGQLAGRDFELTYHQENKRVSDSNDVTPFDINAGDYEIIIDETSGQIIPGVAYIIPQDGDSIVLYNIEMPSEYTSSAQTELEAALDKEMSSYEEDNNTYQMSSDPTRFYSEETDVNMGQAITFVNGSQTLSTRAMMVEKRLDLPCYQTIKIGNKIIKGNTQSLKDEVANANQSIDVINAFNELSKSLSQAYANAQREMVEGFARIGNMWKFDAENENTIYTEFNAYSKGELAAGGFSTKGGGGETGGGGGIDENKLWEILAKEGTQQIDKSHITTALSGYATEQWVLDKKYLTEATLTEQLSKYVTLTALSEQLSKYVTLEVFNPFKKTVDAHISNNNIHLTAEEKEKLSWFAKDKDGNIYVTNGLNFYTEGELSAGGFSDEGGGGTGGLFGIIVNGETYTPENGYITLPDYSTITELSWGAITGTPTTLAGYGITDAYIQNGTIVLGSNNITPLTSSNYSGTLDSRYVKKSGDTMMGSLTVPSLAVSGSTATVSGNKIWHAGNDGSDSGLDADLLDGYHASSILKRFGIDITSKETINVEDYTKSNSYTQEPGNIFSVYGWSWDASAYIKLDENTTLDRMRYSIISYRHGDINKSWNQQALLFLPTYTDDSMIYLAQMNTLGTNDNVIKSIKRYADYDTILASNVASATKLQTPRTIWGQRFDGTANVSGDMTNVGSISMVGSLNGHGGQFRFGSNSTTDTTYGKFHRLDLGYHSIDHCDFYEKEFNFYTNGGSTQWAKIGQTNYFTGNVGIGVSTSNYKLHVNGTFYASGAATLKSTLNVDGATAINNVLNLYTSIGKSLSEINATNGSDNAWNKSGNSSLRIGNSNNLIAIILGGTTNDRNANIQVGHETYNDYANITGSLYLNKLGGNVYLSSSNYTTYISGYGNVTGRLSANGGIYTTDISGNGQALYLGNSNNRSFVYLREDMKANSGNWSIATSGAAYFMGDVGVKTSSPAYALDVRGDISTNASQYINGIRVYKDTDGYLCVQGNLKITGNVAAAGEVAAGQTLTGLTDFLYDVTSFDNYSSTATNRAPTARAVKLIKDKVSSVSSTASSVNTKMNSINTYLSQITSSTTLDQLKTILMNLANAI